MVRRIEALVMLAAALVLFAPTVYASDEAGFEDLLRGQNEAAGTDGLYSALPDDTADLLDDAGIGIESIQNGETDMGALAEAVADMAAEQAKTPLAACGLILAATAISAMIEGVRTPVGGGMTGAACTAAAVASAAAVIAPLAVHIETANKVIQGACGFAEVFVPVLAGIMLAAGQTALSSVYGGAMLTATELISLAVSTAVLPLLRMLLAVACVSSVSPQIKLSGLLTWLEKTTKWLLGLLAVLFVGFVGVSGIPAASVDSVTARTVRFAVAGWLPVIGGPMSEALASVQGCVGILRSSAGAFGVAAMLFTLLPTALCTILWMLGLSGCLAVAEIFDVKPLCQLLKSASAVLSMLLAVTVFAGAVLTVSTTAVMMRGT